MIDSGESSSFDAPRIKEMLHAAVEKSYGKTSVEKCFEPLKYVSNQAIGRKT